MEKSIDKTTIKQSSDFANVVRKEFAHEVENREGKTPDNMEVVEVGLLRQAMDIRVNGGVHEVELYKTDNGTLWGFYFNEIAYVYNEVSQGIETV